MVCGVPICEELHRQTRESVSLYILDGKERVCVERIESLQQIRVVVRLGERMPLHAGASGKVLLAFLPRAQRKALLKDLELVRLTKSTLCDRKRLEQDLLEIEKRGYAISLGERVSGAASVAAPIFDASGGILASLNLTGPTPRVDDAKLEEYVPLVLRAAQEVSRQMGYRGVP